MAPSKPSSTPVFEKDERTLCFHGSFLYEAKVLEVEPIDSSNKKSELRYFVHYKGWKKSWDDWVTGERMKKLNETNKQLANDLKRDYMEQTAKKTSKRKSAIGSDLGSIRDSEERSSSVQASRGTKRGRDFEIEKEEAFISKPAIRIPLPDHLKGILVDDWERITRAMELVPLPHPHPVNDLLEAYRNYELPKRVAETADGDILEEVIHGVREYFDKCLGRILLYRYERQQWLELNERMNGNQVFSPVLEIDETIKLEDKKPSDVYGAEHLCRLFVSMPELIAHTNMDTQAVSRLRDELAKMTHWLSKHATAYFAKNYVHPGQAYVEKARGTG